MTERWIGFQRWASLLQFELETTQLSQDEIRERALDLVDKLTDILNFDSSLGLTHSELLCAQGDFNQYPPIFIDSPTFPHTVTVPVETGEDW